MAILRFAQPSITPAQEEQLFGRLGLISQSLANYNAKLSRSERQEKYQKMAVSSFSFFRGSNHLYWMDFEWDWRMTQFGNYRTRTWLNGDCHAYNFGAYKAHTGGVIYGLNDFDESVVADYQYDLWRLAISLVLLNEDAPKGFPKIKIKPIIDKLCMGYLNSIYDFANNNKADKTAYSVDNTKNPLNKFLKKTATKESRANMLAEWTVTTTDGKLKFDRKNPDVGELASSALYQEIEATIPAYIKTLKSDIDFDADYFTVLDIVARKNAGTGSLGSDRYYVLIQGNKSEEKGNVILDVKEEGKPSGYPFATDAEKAYYQELFPNEGIRYTEAYRALDYHPDDHLGWMKLGDKYFGVRERNPYKKSFKTEKYIKSQADFESMAQQWGKILATEHARASKTNTYSLGEEIRKLTDGNTKAFRKVVKEIAIGYATVVQSDYKLFVKHIVE